MPDAKCTKTMRKYGIAKSLPRENEICTRSEELYSPGRGWASHSHRRPGPWSACLSQGRGHLRRCGRPPAESSSWQGRLRPRRASQSLGPTWWRVFPPCFLSANELPRSQQRRSYPLCTRGQRLGLSRTLLHPQAKECTCNSTTESQRELWGLGRSELCGKALALVCCAFHTFARTRISWPFHWGSQ